MPLGNQYHAGAVHDVLRAVAQTISAFAEPPPELPRASMVEVLRDSLHTVDQKPSSWSAGETGFSGVT